MDYRHPVPWCFPLYTLASRRYAEELPYRSIAVDRIRYLSIFRYHQPHPPFNLSIDLHQQQQNYQPHYQIHTQCLHLITNPTHPWMEQQLTTVIRVHPLAETVRLPRLPNPRNSTDTLQMILPESRGSQLPSRVSWYVFLPTFKISY